MRGVRRACGRLCRLARESGVALRRRFVALAPRAMALRRAWRRVVTTEAATMSRCWRRLAGFVRRAAIAKCAGAGVPAATVGAARMRWRARARQPGPASPVRSMPGGTICARAIARSFAAHTRVAAGGANSCYAGVCYGVARCDALQRTLC